MAISELNSHAPEGGMRRLREQGAANRLKDDIFITAYKHSAVCGSATRADAA
ncbi:hypothetical protein [Dysgonomonas sp. BGC7]|uniref:hypothetical protein n=1 Tax=Dysgonomonas sp. BGC7 TaxID=1658008 RepID=UPI000B02BE9D|nr:hypothetical protein [Dysgonomonas sp. BGC7]MBD8388167.1 hypothetical protein [Dysgonomonas sp. BGC7]